MDENEDEEYVYDSEDEELDVESSLSSALPAATSEDEAADEDEEDEEVNDEMVGQAEEEAVEEGVLLSSIKRRVTFLPIHDVFETKKADIDTVASLCSLSFPNAGLLLRYFKWNMDALQEKYFGHEEEYLQKAGIGEEEVVHEKAVCGVCFDEIDCISLACHHHYCKDCWRGYLDAKLEGEGVHAVASACIDPSCSLLLPPSLFDEVLAEAERERMWNFRLKQIVDTSKDMEWCEGLNCDRVFKRTYKSGFVTCTKCLHATCLECLKQAHFPLSCEETRVWQKKEHDDSQTYTWLDVHTKSCPKCGSRIEKNGGCQHMTCRKCKHQFCWECMQPWEGHANSFRCGVKEDVAQGAVSAEEKIRQLQRYLDVYSTYIKYENMEKALATNVERADKIREAIGKTHPWVEIDSIASVMEATMLVSVWLLPLSQWTLSTYNLHLPSLPCPWHVTLFSTACWMLRK
mmetsp:Transcript_7950/g.20752  ORF Transcript_7950/g.20752 Transcript_7950/m.20752 type:complete len:460 (-) Transcript_7950:512-1891(-)